MTARRPGRASSSAEHGFTLIELIVAMAVIATVALTASEVLISMFKDDQSTADHVTGSNAAMLTNARFREDVASANRPDAANLPADWSAGVTTIGRGQPGCGSDTGSVLRIMSPGATSGTVQMVSYSIVGSSLARRTCSGSTIAGAVAATPTFIIVVPQLTTAPNPVVVTCQATAGGNTVSSDSQCRIVSMRIVTPTGYAFTVSGQRSTGDNPAVSPPVTHRCTLLASGDTNVYHNKPDRNFNDHDDFETPPSGANRTYIENRSLAGYEIRGYFQFDLGSACQNSSAGEPPFMPPGKSLTSASLNLTYEAANQGSSGNCSGTHWVYVLDKPWDPATLTWNGTTATTGAQPNGVNQSLDVFPTAPPAGQPSSRQGTGAQDIFQFGTLSSWPANTPQSFTDPGYPILSTVRHWYAGLPGPGVGDWPNDGWVITTPWNGCDGQPTSFKWSSKGSNSAYSPRLVLTWTE